MERKKANCTKETNGYTLVELITVLAIMGILGTMLVSMLNTGVQFYRTAHTTMDNQNNARLAIAYITVKIRQNDVVNGISVDTSSYPVPVLIIKDANSASGNTFWIYFDGNTHKLREQTGNTGFNPVLNNGAEIADLSYVEITRDPPNDLTKHPPEDPPIHTIKFIITAADGSEYSSQVTLRSYNPPIL